jgi:hypothetical protein
MTNLIQKEPAMAFNYKDAIVSRLFGTQEGAQTIVLCLSNWIKKIHFQK